MEVNQVGKAADGRRHIHESQQNYEWGLWDREKYEVEIKFGIYEISLENKKEAERVAKSYGFALKEIQKMFKDKMVSNADDAGEDSDDTEVPTDF